MSKMEPKEGWSFWTQTIVYAEINRLQEFQYSPKDVVLTADGNLQQRWWTMGVSVLLQLHF